MVALFRHPHKCLAGGRHLGLVHARIIFPAGQVQKSLFRWGVDQIVAEERSRLALDGGDALVVDDRRARKVSAFATPRIFGIGEPPPEGLDLCHVGRAVIFEDRQAERVCCSPAKSKLSAPTVGAAPVARKQVRRRFGAPVT